MKIRNGFVSNSSSSSFIVAVPHGKQLTEELVREALGLKGANSIFDGIVGMIAGAKKYSTKDFLDDHSYESFAEAIKDGNEVAQLADGGWDIYQFHADDQSGADDYFLCMTQISVRTKKIIIEGGGGY